MAFSTEETLNPDADEAVRTVLRETLELLRAALESVLGADEADDYGLSAG